MSTSQLASARNLGPASAAMLAAAGFDSMDDLRDVGPVVAFLAVRQTGQRPSLNLLWAIYGAVHDCHWTSIPKDTKQQLLAELEEYTR